MKQFEQDKEKARLKELRQQSEAVFQTWLSKHPQVPNCEAVAKLFRDYMDFTDGLVEADFDFAFGNLESSIMLLPLPTKRQIAHEMRQMTTPELKNELKAMRAAQEGKYTGYPDLPQEMVPAGKVRAVTVDAAYIRGLSPFELRRLCRVYSVQQVNNRLAQVTPAKEK
jgi:hypothetical protein